MWYPDPAFALDRLDDERGKSFGSQLLLERFRVVKLNCLCARQQWTEAIPPERIAH